MDINLLISKFLNISKYDQDDETLLILVYGSRVNGTNNSNSDLDVLVVTSKNNSYRRRILIDNVPIDITYISIIDLESDIYDSIALSSSYYHSIFKNGIIILDKMNTLETIKDMLDLRVPRKKRLDSRVMDSVKYHINEFVNSSDNLHYFVSLELLRRLHHVNNNCSYIRFTKVYDLYTDKAKAKDLYLLKLPDEEYRSIYLKALSEDDPKKRLEYLEYFYHEFTSVKFNELKDDYYLSKEEIKKRLFELNNAISKCIEMLESNHPYARCLYYILINNIYSLYELIYHKQLDIIDYNSDDNNILISNLENLFNKLDESYKIDYNNVTLKLF